jgi:serine phosphatase RsbU (regulator of sigma subunit)
VSRDNPAALFITVFAGLLDLDSGELQYCNAGHENPWLVSARDANLPRLSDGGGPPLCVVEDFDYRVARRTLQAGDIVCIVSDGITEAQGERNELYGTARVERALQGATTAREVLERVRADVKRFAGDRAQADDITVLAIRWE